MWFGKLGMTKVQFDIQANSRSQETQYNIPKCGKDSFH